MSEDIVEWLRADDNHMTWTRDRMLEAADEIERLRADNERLARLLMDAKHDASLADQG